MEVNMRRSILGAILFVSASMVAFAQSATPSDPAQDHKELQQLNHDALQDKQAAQNEQNAVNKDREEVKTAVKDGDKAEANKDRQDLRQAKTDLNQDKHDIKQDMRQSRQIRQNAQSMGPRGGGRR
jgi:uncharacterized membrane protein